MRKFYSIVLTACALLLSTSLFAETRNVSVSEWADLKSNIESAQAGDVLNITIAQTINADGAAPIRIYASKDAATGITVNLNMNGKSIIASNMTRVFELYRGTLNVTGDGEIRANEYGTKSVIAFFVAGYSSQATSNWSHLIIGKNIKVEAPGSNVCGYAISVNEVQAYSQSKTVTDNNYPIADDVDVSAHFNDLGITFTRKKDFNFLDYTTEWYTTSNGTTLGGKKATAYGVVVDIYGTVHASKYAVKVNGNINSKPEAKYMDNLPTINVYPGAQMLADNAKKSVAVYASGYANYNIEGTVKGATGVYIKSGNVTLENATIASTYSGKYEEITGKKSGVQAGGSGVVIESNPSYCGGQDVKITGDTKIEATSGYAVEENITTPDNSTKVNALTIEGGTLIAGEKGTVIVTKQTLDDDEIVVSVVGGNFDGDGKFQVKDTETGETTSAEVKDFLPNDNYFTTTVIDANNKEVTVVTNGTGFGSINKEDGNSVVATTSGAIVWKNSTTKTETINLDVLTDAEKQDNNTRTLSYLEINNDDYEQTLIIDGVTLRVGRIVMGKNAHIIVKAGARLIVDGEQGIVAPVTSNIVLETSESNPSQFLFNPLVTSNRHPNATVSLIANSYTNPDDPANDYLYQRFGVPTHNAVKNVTAKKGNENVQVGFRIYENNGWTSLGYVNVSGQSLRKDRMNVPFGYYTLQCNSPKGAGTIVSFEGELMGNGDATLATGANTNGWSTFTNSYNANLNMANMLSMFDGLVEANAAIYFQKQQQAEDNAWDWQAWDNTVMHVLNENQRKAIVNLNPMQAFLIKDPADDVTIGLNYQNMVWNPAMGIAPKAPARRVASNLTKAAVNLIYGNAVHDAVYMIQGDEFSSEIEKGYDSEKYMSGNANIYVMNDKKYATCATDNLENTYLGFSCAEAGNYTISFENIAGEGLALVDMVANKVINMTEGATYEFYAQESNDYRFKVVGRNNVATDVETIENAVKAAGVYTLTGMYLGNMSVWNTLPAGVYVVDGEKRVK